MKTIIEIDKDDLFLMLSALMRYSLGRKTYMVGFAIDRIKEYWSNLHPIAQAQLVKELDDAILRADDMHYRLGDEQDHKQWIEAWRDLHGRLHEEDHQEVS